MSRGKTMFFNTILLTATALLMRTVGLGFQVFLSNKIGASGIGLFQLIMSVSMLAATFSISGIRFATTRLVSEELGLYNTDGIKKAVVRCLTYAFCFGTAAMLVLYFSSNYIGEVWVGDGRTVLSLKLLALSLPAFAMSSVLSGYFTAVCRVIKSAAVQLAEQMIRISVIVAALSFIPSANVEYACAAIVVGGVAGEIASFILLFFLYLHDRRRYVSRGKRTKHITERMIKIAIPLALTAYARTALSTVENLLIPRGFRKSGASTEMALADYGMIQGMVFPIITFPATIFFALSELLVPELTDAQVTGNEKRIAGIANRTLRLCILFSIGVLGVLFTFSDELGTAIYKSENVGHYIKLLSLLMPILYLDNVTDGMLRGLGEQIYYMRINILDSLISVILVYILLPKYAVMGFIFVIYFTEVFNFIFSMHRLRKVTKISISFSCIVKSLIAAIGSVNISAWILRSMGLHLSAVPIILIIHIFAAIILYVLLLCILDCIEKRDVEWFISMFRR